MAGRIQSTIRNFLDSESSGGLLLIASAIAALLVANSPLAETYFRTLHVYLGPLSIQHWVNDALMAIFFLMVGLEIKREMVDGHLSSWPRRVLPGAAAAAGMAVPQWSTLRSILTTALPTVGQFPLQLILHLPLVSFRCSAPGFQRL